METIRAFIAIELSPAVRQAVGDLQNRLKALTPPRSVRWTVPENIHLTLHFLGEIEANLVRPIATEISATARKHPSFELLLGSLGCFPNVRRPRVLWVGLLEQNQVLTGLQRDLGEALRGAVGFSPDARPYAPHLTLGRVKKGISTRHLKQLSQVIQNEQQQLGQLVRLEVSEIVLIKSDLRPDGPVYTHLAAEQLSG
jgi:2'-5' RNA ligase